MTMLARVDYQSASLSTAPRQNAAPPMTHPPVLMERAARLARDDVRRAAGDSNAPIAAVYAIRHRQTGRCYIGVTVDLRKRHLQHLADLRNGRHLPELQADWFRDGPDAFEWLVLEADGSFEAENDWITSTPVALLYNYVLEPGHDIHRDVRSACPQCRWDIGADQRAERQRVKLELQQMVSALKRTLNHLAGEPRRNAARKGVETRRRHAAEQGRAW
jgi:GIY-YIG catalytic domain